MKLRPVKVGSLPISTRNLSGAITATRINGVRKIARMTPVIRATPPIRHRLSRALIPQKSNAAINAPVDLDA